MSQNTPSSSQLSFHRRSLLNACGHVSGLCLLIALDLEGSIGGAGLIRYYLPRILTKGDRWTDKYNKRRNSSTPSPHALTHTH